MTYIEIITGKKQNEWPASAERNLRNFAKLAQKYLVSNVIVKHNCYPWENKIISLIDAGGIKIGSPAIDLGCMYCHPNVYKELKHSEGAIKYFAEKYVEKMQIYANESGKKIGEDIPFISPENLEKGSYVGGIFGNVRMASGYLFYKDISPEKVQDMGHLLACIEQQLDILSQKDKDAVPIVDGLAQLSIIKEKDALRTVLEGFSNATTALGKGIKDAWRIWSERKMRIF